METQNKKVIKHFKSGKSLTAKEAWLKYGIMRLAARIHEIKEMGYKILDRPVKVRGAVVKRYWMGAGK